MRADLNTSDFEPVGLNQTVVGANVCVSCEHQPSTTIVQARCPSCTGDHEFNFTLRQCVACLSGYSQSQQAAQPWHRCKPMSCSSSHPGSCVNASAPLASGANCSIACDAGYTLVGAPYSCLRGNLSGGNQSCQPSSCASPLLSFGGGGGGSGNSSIVGRPLFGSAGSCVNASTPLASGANCNIACDAGYTLLGAAYSCLRGNLSGGNQSCHPTCAAGSFKDIFIAEEAAACRECPLQTFAPDSNFFACTACPLGRYTSNHSSTNCMACSSLAAVSTTLSYDEQWSMRLRYRSAPDNFALLLSQFISQFVFVPRGSTMNLPGFTLSGDEVAPSIQGSWSVAMWLSPLYNFTDGVTETLISQLGSWSLHLGNDMLHVLLPGISSSGVLVPLSKLHITPLEWFHLTVTFQASPAGCSIAVADVCQFLLITTWINGGRTSAVRFIQKALAVDPSDVAVDLFQLQQLADASLLVGAHWASVQWWDPIAAAGLAPSDSYTWPSFNGVVDEVKFWLRCLTADEVATAWMDTTLIQPYRHVSALQRQAALDLGLYRNLSVYLDCDEGSGKRLGQFSRALLVSQLEFSPEWWPRFAVQGPLAYSPSQCIGGMAPLWDVSQPSEFVMTPCCSACPAGMYSVNSSSHCLQCPIGRFAAAAASDTCQMCPAGTSTRSEGAVECQEDTSGTLPHVPPLGNGTRGDPWNFPDVELFPIIEAEFSTAPTRRLLAWWDAISGWPQPWVKGYEAVANPANDPSFELRRWELEAQRQAQIQARRRPGLRIRLPSRTTLVSTGIAVLSGGGMVGGSVWLATHLPSGSASSGADRREKKKKKRKKGGGGSGADATDCPAGSHVLVFPEFFDPVYELYECVPCDPGEYSGANAEECVQCSVGRATASSGSSSCSLCFQGTFAPNNGSIACMGCDVLSTVASSELREVCLCAGGHGAFNRSSGVCYRCEAGEAAPAAIRADSLCEPCPTGSYQSLSAQSACQLCIEGTYSNVTGSSSCHRCNAGSISALGASSCRECAAGSYANGTVCSPCAPGHAQSSSGQSQCRPCDRGSSTPGPGSTSCPECTPGRFQSGIGATSCQTCSVGRYQALAGQTSCSLCPLGSVPTNLTHTEVPHIAAVACEACLHGISSINQTRCINCTAGQIIDRDANLCVACSAGRYQPRSPPVYVSLTDHDQCHNCSAGRFARLPGQSSCAACSHPECGPTCDCGVFQVCDSHDGRCVCQPGLQFDSSGRCDCSSALAFGAGCQGCRCAWDQRCDNGVHGFGCVADRSCSDFTHLDGCWGAAELW